MGKILKSLIEDLGENYTIVRVTIRGDEQFGEAIIESVNGTPSTWHYIKEMQCWG